MKKTLLLMITLGLFSCKHNDSSLPYTKVYKSDSSIQCESTGIALDAMAMELVNAGIDVVCAQKGDDGLTRITVCGAGTGIINVYTIHASNLVDAQALGFNPVSELSEYQDQECK